MEALLELIRAQAAATGTALDGQPPGSLPQACPGMGIGISSLGGLEAGGGPTSLAALAAALGGVGQVASTSATMPQAGAVPGVAHPFPGSSLAEQILLLASLQQGHAPAPAPGVGGAFAGGSGGGAVPGAEELLMLARAGAPDGG